jgi:hypothetical protein
MLFNPIVPPLGYCRLKKELMSRWEVIRKRGYKQEENQHGRYRQSGVQSRGKDILGDQ